jgi:hypothetical protein
MKPSEMLIGLLVFSSVFIGAGIFASSIIGTYNPDASSNVRTLNYTNKIIDTYGYDTQTKLTGQGVNIITAAETILSGGWTALLSIVTMPSLINDVGYDVKAATGNVVDIPVWFIILITSVVVIIIVFKILGTATKSETGGL